MSDLAPGKADLREPPLESEGILECSPPSLIRPFRSGLDVGDLSPKSCPSKKQSFPRLKIIHGKPPAKPPTSRIYKTS